jgi:PKD repeat protein
MKKNLLFIIAIIASIYQVTAQCLMYPVLLSQRIPQSQLIIEGAVINQQSFWNTDHNKIYTSNLIEVYKTFKNTSAAYIEVITEGGIVGNDKHVFEPTLELEVGDVGVFTLNTNTQLSQFGKVTYDAYASAQGFIKYDVEANTASEPFNNYVNASSTLYTTIAQFTNSNYNVIKTTNPFQLNTSVNTVQGVTAITSFTPTTITAGTFSVLTINGTGFGAVSTASLIGFKTADDGGATFTSPVASEVVSWSNTQIQVRVPSGAGTGVIRVNGLNSTGVLTIPYSHLNVNNAGSIYNTKHYAQSGGGYVWTYNTAFNTNAPAKAAFQRSLQSWRCATFINWPTASTTSTVTASTNDGINIVTFNSSLGAGILGQCGSYWSGCGTNPNMQWIVAELDIQFANSPGGLTWQYGPALPSGSQYDFETVTVHELGHGHQLGHVINNADLMHFAVAAGQSKRTLNTDDLNGGLAVMVRNAQVGGACGLTLMTPLNASNCALGSPTASFTANRTTICSGQTVAYTDASTGNPTVWQWTFQGGTPATSAVQNPTITYNTPGTYSVALTASNTAGFSVSTKTAYITVTTAATLPLTQSFQTALFPPAQWSVIDGGNDGFKWQLSTAAGQASTQSALFDNYSPAVNISGTKDELRTQVNLTGFTTSKMTFYRSYGATFTSPNIDTLEIRVSTNCNTSSTQVYYKGGSQIGTGAGNNITLFVPTAAEWAKDSIDLTPYVGNNNVSVSIINRSRYGDAMYLDNINITGIIPTAPTASITVSSNTACIGQSITLTDASTGSPTSWAWTMTGGTPASASTQNSSVSYATSGVKTISLTVANATGTTTATKTITVIASPVTALTATNVSCFGTCNGVLNGTSTGGSGPYTYTVSGSSCSILPCTALCAGAYTVTTANSNGCLSTSTISITQPTALNATSTFTNVTCNGLCNGVVSFIGNGGTAPYNSVITQSTTTCAATTCTNLCAGTVSATVTDSKGCTYTTTVNITQPAPVVINATASSSLICVGGISNLSASGATSYTWSPSASLTSANGATVNANPASPTIYTVQGNNGICLGTTTVTVNVNTCTGISTSNNITGLNVSPNPSNGVFTITSDLIASSLKLTVTNALGQLVLDKTLQNTNQSTIDLSGMSKGIYYLSLVNDTERAIIKLIVD